MEVAACSQVGCRFSILHTVIPVRECIRSAYNGKCHGWYISQKGVIMHTKNRGFWLSMYACSFEYITKTIYYCAILLQYVFFTCSEYCHSCEFQPRQL